MFPHSHSGTEQGEHSNLRCLLSGTWEQAGCWQQDSKFQSTDDESKAGKQNKQLNHMEPPLLLYPHPNHSPSPQVTPMPSLKLCSPNRTESPWDTKNLFHNSLMRAGLVLVKAFTLKTHFWKWSCSLCCQSSSENLKLSENQKSKVTEAFAVALFPLQWLLFKAPLS